MHPLTSEAAERCIDASLHCFRVCTQMASIHCLQIGGEHAQPGHLRVMLECAEACRANAQFLLIDGEYANVLCESCAHICRACAESCRMLEGMHDCVAACERCAERCEAMANAPQLKRA